LNGLFFLFANTSPGEAGGAVPNAAPPSLSGPLTTLTLLGKVELVGVPGSTLTLEWGDLALCPATLTVGDVMDAEDVEEALECEWWWCGIERMEDTEEEVDFLPRRPPDVLL
jgi:hypothetical protein